MFSGPPNVGRPHATARDTSASASSRAATADGDLAVLPGYVFADRQTVWWGTVGLMTIEGAVFALGLVVYFYVRKQGAHWPPGVGPPDLEWGTLNLAILLGSLVPNFYTRQAAERRDLTGVRIGMLVSIVFVIAFLVVRVLEFGSLNCRWDTGAYGSAVWMLLGLHTVHLATDTLDSTTLAALMWRGPNDGRRFGDVSDDARYWNFVVASWVPIYVVIYLAPRWM